MTQKVIYIVQRYEMPMDDTPGIDVFFEKAFLTAKAAKDYCLNLDPNNNGIEYECPCGCNDKVLRSWEYSAAVLEEE